MKQISLFSYIFFQGGFKFAWNLVYTELHTDADSATHVDIDAGM